MSSLGRPSTTIDLNTGTITAVNTIQTSVQVVQQETIDNKEYFESLIGQQGVTRDEETDEITKQYSVQNNLDNLYFMMTGKHTTETEDEQVIGPLIKNVSIYDNFDYVYKEDDTVYTSLNTFKNFVGYDEKPEVLEERDTDGNIIVEYQDRIEPTGIFLRLYDIEKADTIIPHYEYSSIYYVLLDRIMKLILIQMIIEI